MLIDDTRISPVFDTLFEGCSASERREAIVLYRVPAPEAVPLRGRLRVLKQRLDRVKQKAAAQQPVASHLFESYQEAGAKELGSAQQLAMEAVGGSALPIAAMEVTRSTLPVLAEQPDVLAILPNQPIHLIGPEWIKPAAAGTSEAQQGRTWGLEQLEIPRLWEIARGEQIQVAVLDTGVHGDHPALAGRVKSFVVIDPLGRRITASPAFDCGNHGTHVCGTIAGGNDAGGVSIGVAPGADLHVAGVLIGKATLRTLLEGISWAVQRGADIISMSLGFGCYEPLFAEVFRLLIDQYGILPVVAVGNSSHGNTSSPGNAHNALTVGAAGRSSAGMVEVAGFSSGASLVFPGDEPHGLVTKPDLVAPGVQVYSCIPPEHRPEGTREYAYLNGSSMATPHVAGAAALLMAAKPNAPVTGIIQVLKETAEHPAGAEWRPDNRWGYGMVRPWEALRALA